MLEMNRSDCYNPFVYLREEADVIKLVTNLMKNTTPKGSTPSEPFWEYAEGMFLQRMQKVTVRSRRTALLTVCSTKEQKSEVMRALAAKVPKEVILSYFYPDTPVMRMVEYCREYGQTME